MSFDAHSEIHTLEPTFAQWLSAFPEIWEGYDLSLESVVGVNNITDSGERLVIVARLTGSDDALHFRVFNASETMVLDESEDSFPLKENEIDDLRAEIVGLWAQTLTAEQKASIIERVASITGLTLWPEPFDPHLYHPGPSETGCRTFLSMFSACEAIRANDSACRTLF